MPETQEVSTTAIGLADVPNTQEDQEEMLSSLSLDDLPDEAQKAEPAPMLYLVVVRMGGFTHVEQMATLEDLRAELIALEGEEVHVYIFAGERQVEVPVDSPALLEPPISVFTWNHAIPQVFKLFPVLPVGFVAFAIDHFPGKSFRRSNATR